MTKSANDEYFSIREHLLSLSEEDAISLASTFIDANCSAVDSEYLKQALVAAGSLAQELACSYAANGSPAAQTVLGAAMLHGHFCDKNIAQGLFWLRRAHNNGNSKASIMLCGAYLDGVSLRRDASKAVAYIVDAANSGDAAAQYIYANLLIDGDGIAQDEDEGIFWLRQSAERGYERATKMLMENDLSLHDE